MNQKPKSLQESTSVYFNNIIRRDVTPKSVNELDAETIDNFNRQIELAFLDDAEGVKMRVSYLAPYILQNIDWEEYSTPLEAWQLRFYYQRSRFLDKTGLSYENFLTHKPLQEAIKKLHLMPEPVFEFILFLNYYYGLRSDLRFSCVEQFNILANELGMADNKTVSMDVCIAGKHFKINNTKFIQRMFVAVDLNQLSDSAFSSEFTQGSSREKIRALDYYLVKTLLDYLPIDKSQRKRGRFSQIERDFGLSVLSLCGRLPDNDRAGVCGKENNATLDKLMRDFAHKPIPFAMELYL